MRIYLKNNPVKFHPDPIWNDGALGFFEELNLVAQAGRRSSKNPDTHDTRSRNRRHILATIVADFGH